MPVADKILDIERTVEVTADICDSCGLSPVVRFGIGVGYDGRSYDDMPPLCLCNACLQKAAEALT